MYELSMVKAIVFWPYFSSSAAFGEYYRMNIPLFVPTPELMYQQDPTFGYVDIASWGSIVGPPAGTCTQTQHTQNHHYI